MTPKDWHKMYDLSKEDFIYRKPSIGLTIFWLIYFASIVLAGLWALGVL